MNKKTIWLVASIAVVFGLSGVYFGLSHDAGMPPANDAGNSVARLFEQSLPDSNGTRHELSKLQGKRLLVNFWATWCAPCVEEMPELSALQQQHPPQELQIIGLGIDTADNIRQFAAKYHIAYPLYVTGMAGAELSKQLGNRQGGLPFTILIGRDGQIKKTYLGRLQINRVREDLAQLR